MRSDGLRVFVNQVPNVKDPGGSFERRFDTYC